MAARAWGFALAVALVLTAIPAPAQADRTTERMDHLDETGNLEAEWARSSSPWGCASERTSSQASQSAYLRLEANCTIDSWATDGFFQLPGWGTFDEIRLRVNGLADDDELRIEFRSVLGEFRPRATGVVHGSQVEQGAWFTLPLRVQQSVSPWADLELEIERASNDDPDATVDVDYIGGTTQGEDGCRNHPPSSEVTIDGFGPHRLHVWSGAAYNVSMVDPTDPDGDDPQFGVRTVPLTDAHQTWRTISLDSWDHILRRLPVKIVDDPGERCPGGPVLHLVEILGVHVHEELPLSLEVAGPGCFPRTIVAPFAGIEVSNGYDCELDLPTEIPTGLGDGKAVTLSGDASLSVDGEERVDNDPETAWNLEAGLHRYQGCFVADDDKYAREWCTIEENHLYIDLNPLED